MRGWGKSEDEALVLGTYTYGYGQYDLIRGNMAPFSESIWHINSPEQQHAHSHTANDKHSEQVKSEEDESVGTASVTTASTHNSSSAVSPIVENVNELSMLEAQAVKTWPSRQTLNERLVKVVLAMEKRTQAAAKLAIQATNAAHDRGRRGISVPGKETLIAESILDGDDAAYEDEDEDEEERGSSATGRRGKRGSINYTPPSTRGRGSRGRGRGRGGAQGRIGSTGNLHVPRWSKRDRNEYLRIIGSFGLPVLENEIRDWTDFRALGSFSVGMTKASDRVFDDYTERFLKACASSATIKSRRGRKKINPEPVSEEEEEAAESEHDSESDSDTSSDNEININYLDKNGNKLLSEKPELKKQSSDTDYYYNMILYYHTV
jgi:hypothetical protein